MNMVNTMRGHLRYNRRHQLLLSSSLFFLVYLVTYAAAQVASDTLTKGSNLTDGETMVSSGGPFTLGFFTPVGGVPGRRYLGIWFTVTSSSIACWVANGDRPINGTSGVLVVTDTGNLVLLDGSGRTAWASNTAGAASPTVQLLDSGNLVLRDAMGSDARLWQSFDHPTNTLLPGMKIGRNLWGGGAWSLRSWTAPGDPSPGAYRYVMDTGVLPEIRMLDSSGAIKYRTGVWNGLWFSGIPMMKTYSDRFAFQVTVSPSEISFSYTAKPGGPSLSRVVLNETTAMAERLGWNAERQTWDSFFKGPEDHLCDAYASCGPSCLCDESAAQRCTCVPGFSPVAQPGGSTRYTPDACRRDVPLDCGSNKSRIRIADRFVPVREVKLPDTRNSSVNPSITLEECRDRCLANCTCVAYAAADIQGGGDGTGCIMWPEPLTDLRHIADGQTLYLRLASSESANSWKKKVLVAAGSALGSLLILFAACLAVQGARTRSRSLTIQITEAVQNVNNPCIVSIPLATVKSATRNFSRRNVIGEGTFGIVYKGKLSRGQALLQGLAGRSIAVKRLKQISDLPETIISYFTREMQVMSGLRRHQNVLRLLAYCDEGNERILVYEYMHRGSLAAYIFGKPKERASLNWQRRLQIIQGIAEGVKHLHEGEGSHGNVIHRDLKPANVLLDGGWTAKVADFGTAKLLLAGATGTRTRIGTPGYMAPEYVQCEGGETTLKCDVYSFGVTLLETLSGRRNCERPSLISETWRLWVERSITSLLDSAVAPPPTKPELLLLRRYIQVALLCVQETTEVRPGMPEVVEMLSGASSKLAEPMVPLVGSRILGTFLEADLSRPAVYETIDLT